MSEQKKIRQKFFSPAIAVLNSMDYTKKFSLFWLVLLIAFAAMACSLFISLNMIIRPLQRELQGLTLMNHIVRAVQVVQKHRVVLPDLLGGNAPLNHKRTVNEKNISEAFNSIEKALPPGLALSANFETIKTIWERAQKNLPDWTEEENFAIHTELIEQLQLFELLVIDDFALIVDSDVATFYLIDTTANTLPMMLEHLSQIVASGINILANKNITELQKEKLISLNVGLDIVLKQFNSNVERTAHYNPALQKTILAMRDNINYSARYISSLVSSDILTGHFSTAPDVFFDAGTVAIDSGYSEMYKFFIPTIHSLIEARKTQAERMLFLSIGSAVLLFLLAAYISTSLYYAIVGGIQKLSRSAHAFADGDLSTRIQLGTYDELNSLGDSFNAMADGLGVLLEVHRADEARLLATMETGMDAMVHMNAEGVIIGWSSQAENIFGWSRKEVIGRALHETIILDRSRQEYVQILERFVTSSDKVGLSARIEIIGLHRDGHEFPVELSIAPIRLAGQKEGEYEFSAFIRDITKYKQLEQEQRIAAVAFEAQAGIAITDQNGVIVRVNNTFSIITGYSTTEAVGNTFRILKSDRHDSEFYRQMWKTLLHNKYWEGEIWNRRKNGEIYPEWLTITAVVGEDGKANNYVAIFVDIIERKHHEEQMQATASELLHANVQVETERAQLAARVAERTAQLQYANLAKDSFLATMSHEIRTPLGGMLGMMELISLSRLDIEQRKMLQAARESGQSLLRIVDDILDWSKIEAGKLELDVQVASISEMLKGVVSTYSPLASAKGLSLKHQFDSKLSAVHVFDRLRLSQILNNFTSNAIKFTERGVIEIGAELVNQQNGVEEVYFCVKDTGIGISEEQQVRLFQWYHQASVETARMYGGTGLGLAICRSLADMMGGDISLKSSLGNGSTFFFTISLPVASPAAQRDLRLRQAWENNSENLSGFRPLLKDGKRVSVLLVDDHPLNRTLLKKQLETLGMYAEEAASGVEALSLWRNGNFDLVITDCHMPEMDGYELTRSIRSIKHNDGRQQVTIIAWTANVLSDEEERCRAAGMDDILTKPTEIVELRAMLLKWLARSGAGFIQSPVVEAATDSGHKQAAADRAIDLGVLRKIATNYAAQAEMLQVFKLHNRADVADLRTALNEGNPTSVQRSAHRIKGASRMVGALELEGVCAAIERAAVQGDMHGARVMADIALDETLGSVEAAISAFIGGK